MKVPTKPASAHPRWRELAARAYDYGACSSHKEPKALLNSRYELQARTSGGKLAPAEAPTPAYANFRKPFLFDYKKKTAPL